MIESLAAIMLVIVIIIICLVYTSRASTEISSVKSPDDKLNQAKKYLLGISIAGWILIIALVGGMIALFVYGEELIYTQPWIFNGILALVIIISLIIGIVAALAATQIGNSSIYPTGDTGSVPVLKAYEFSIIAAVTGILIFIQSIIILTYSINGSGEYVQRYPPMQGRQVQRYPPMQGRQVQRYPPMQGRQVQRYPPVQGRQVQRYPPQIRRYPAPRTAPIQSQISRLISPSSIEEGAALL